MFVSQILFELVARTSLILVWIWVHDLLLTPRKRHTVSSTTHSDSQISSIGWYQPVGFSGLPKSITWQKVKKQQYTTRLRDATNSLLLTITLAKVRQTTTKEALHTFTFPKDHSLADLCTRPLWTLPVSPQDRKHTCTNQLVTHKQLIQATTSKNATYISIHTKSNECSSLLRYDSRKKPQKIDTPAFSLSS